MHQIGMSDKKPMAGAERVPEVKYSAAYSTGRELMLEPRYGCAEEASLRRAATPKVSPKGLQRAARELMRNRRRGGIACWAPCRPTASMTTMSISSAPYGQYTDE